MSFELKPLPYAPDALDPVISAETMSYHYEKHHRGYVKKLNAAIEGSSREGETLASLIRSADESLFNNAAQIWNHDFYWSSLSPDGGGEPSGELAQALASAFGSADGFRKEFAQAAKGQFGSGWAWLVTDADGRLSVTSTSDAGNPMTDGHTPILTLDVWEHAYYVDYRNERARYVDACIEHLLNWKHAEACYAAR
ncbi:MAG: superoxide dismutase [Xanthomonadales bacterium]|nr:superoxide dismutase [Xanthomonadales bacterium]